MTKVAVITRTKDRPAFLKRAVMSVANQTYTDYEHIIVNDGGDKAAVEAAIDLCPIDKKSKIKVFHREKSSGAPDTIFNESVRYSGSEYVTIHDDDDSWHPEFLERTVSLMESGAKGVVVRTDKITETYENSKIKIKKATQYQSDIKVISIYRQFVDNQLTPISFIYRRDVFDELDGYDDSLPVVGDWEFGIRFLLKYDVEYLDPGFALAQYHHRIKKQADNSFSGHDHRYYFNLVANRYLRNELQQGILGPGYIISQIRYEQSFLAKTLSRLLPGKLAAKLKSRVS